MADAGVGPGLTMPMLRAIAGTWVVLALTVAPPAGSQTRAAEIAERQAAKARGSQPYTPSAAERLLRRLDPDDRGGQGDAGDVVRRRRAGSTAATRR